MTDHYTPNQIPAAERVLNIVYAVMIIAFAGIGLATGELLLPGKRTVGPNGLALQGAPAWFMYAAMACACVVLISVVADH